MADENNDEKKIKCPECGKEIPADSKYCPHCDYPLAFAGALERIAKVKSKGKRGGGGGGGGWIDKLL
jgi:predicted amidophosphoribosyltransferase